MSETVFTVGMESILAVLTASIFVADILRQEALAARPAPAVRKSRRR